jgi:hypothetical protein
MYVANVFIWMLQKVDPDVAYVAIFYTRMLQESIPNVSSVFRCMLQVF